MVIEEERWWAILMSIAAPCYRCGKCNGSIIGQSPLSHIYTHIYDLALVTLVMLDHNTTDDDVSGAPKKNDSHINSTLLPNNSTLLPN